MSLSVPDRSMVLYEGNSSNRTNRERVEDAATATGAAGAGVAATRGSALKFFKSAENLNHLTGTAAQTSRALELPARQSKSLINAFKINYRNFTNQIAEWAKNSNMPNFMKVLFTGKAATLIGKGAAVFVFITGLGEVFHTLMKNINTVGEKMAKMTANPDDFDAFEYMDTREAYARAYANSRRRY